MSQQFFNLCMNNKLQEAKVLWSAGGIDLAFQDAGRRTAVAMAAGRGHEEMVRWLIEIGSPLETADGDGRTALGRAASLGKLEVMDILMKAGADIEAPNPDGKRIFMDACDCKQPEAAMKLLAGGASPVSIRKDGLSNLAVASRTAYIDIVRFLLEQGASPNSVDSYNNTPLYYALNANKFETASLLVEYGADLNDCSEGKVPVLFSLIENHVRKGIEWVLKNGADPKRKDLKGRDGFEALRQMNYLEFIPLAEEASILSADMEGTASSVDGQDREDEKVPQYQAAHSCKDMAEAICKKDAGEVKRFLEEGISANEPLLHCGEYTMPLALCMGCYDEGVARVILESGIDINLVYHNMRGNQYPDNNYMEMAISAAKADMIKLLLEYGFDFTLPYRDRYSYVDELVHQFGFHTLHQESLELLQLFIENGAPVGFCELKELPYRLQWDKMQYNRTIAETMLQACRDVNDVDMDGCSILHYYLREYRPQKDRSGNPLSRTESARDMLLSLLLGQTDVDVTLRNYADETPLYLACVHGPDWSVAALLRMGAQVSDICTKNNITLIHAAKSDPVKLAALQEFGADINTPDEEGNNLLHLACGARKEYIRNEFRPLQTLDIVPFLLEQGIDANKADNKGNMPLHYLVLADSPEVLKTIDLLLEHHAELNVLNESLRTPFFLSAVSYNSQFKNQTQPVLKHLLARGAMIDMQDIDGKTPLGAAVENEDAVLVRFLLENGADPAIQDNLGNSPYKKALQKNARAVIAMIEKAAVCIELDGDDMDAAFLNACKGGKRGVAEMLVKRGNVDITYVDNDGRSALHYVAGLGMLSLAGFLVEHGADINYTDKWGQTALHFAASARQREMVRFLLELGADTAAADNSGVLPIHLVTNRGQQDMLKLFLTHGSDPFVLTNDGESLLITACYTRSRECVRLLLEAGLDVDIADNNGITPLQVAVRNNQADMVHLLREFGVDITAVNAAGAQAIHVAASKGFKEMVRLLAGFGAAVDARNNMDMTALHIAAMNGNKDMFKCLAELGADLDAKTSEGKSCLDIAAENNQKEIIELSAIIKKRREVLGGQGGREQ